MDFLQMWKKTDMGNLHNLLVQVEESASKSDLLPVTVLQT